MLHCVALPWDTKTGSLPQSAFRLGSAFPNGLTQAWRGRLSDVCAFFGPGPSADVKLLYSGNAAHPHNGCAALDTKYP